ncbi:RNA polymerase sigma factor [Dactylosporangium sp. CA-152071]|uniref:RNA polymerase sigma factor n=1 Tax=Dactylosporangium sp. CA-152071 TaxID=3239933 RepID=UPI003D8E679C
MANGAVEDLRELVPQVLGALVRRYGHFDTCEDAVQEALLDATVQWPSQGVPNEPRTWLIRVASRRLVDLLRSEQARSRREATWQPPTPAAVQDQDDSLTLLFLCCHPALTPPAQLALTLRAVGGLGTAEIARALLTPEATVAQRISRAKATIRQAGATFRMPAPEQFEERLEVVLTVLYLIFTEGYVGTSGDTLHRAELAAEAIRLTRLLHALLPARGDVAGLLALMLLTHARRAARVADGMLVPLESQDCSLWDHAAIDEGRLIAESALRAGPPGPYQLQAAIAAVHTSSPTDWRQILGLYRLLGALDSSPVVTLNRAVAEAMVHGPAAGLALLETLADDPQLARSHRPAAVRAHLLAMRGSPDAAGWYRTAATLTTNRVEQRYLLACARSNDACGFDDQEQCDHSDQSTQ